MFNKSTLTAIETSSPTMIHMIDMQSLGVDVFTEIASHLDFISLTRFRMTCKMAYSIEPLEDSIYLMDIYKNRTEITKERCKILLSGLKNNRYFDISNAKFINKHTTRFLSSQYTPREFMEKKRVRDLTLKDIPSGYDFYDNHFCVHREPHFTIPSIILKWYKEWPHEENDLGDRCFSDIIVRRVQPDDIETILSITVLKNESSDPSDIQYNAKIYIDGVEGKYPYVRHKKVSCWRFMDTFHDWLLMETNDEILK